jgi:hypothetical protein
MPCWVNAKVGRRRWQSRVSATTPVRKQDLAVFDPYLVDLPPYRQVERGLPALYVELPAAPGTGEPSLLAAVAVRVRSKWKVGARDAAVTQRPTVVGALVSRPRRAVLRRR